MNRKQIIDFINNDILPQINSAYTWQDITSGKELIKIVCDFRKDQIKQRKAHINDTYKSKVIDGFLYINDIPVKRIAPKDPRPAWNEAAYYYEGKILARQEAVYFD